MSEATYCWSTTCCSAACAPGAGLGCRLSLWSIRCAPSSPARGRMVRSARPRRCADCGPRRSGRSHRGSDGLPARARRVGDRAGRTGRRAVWPGTPRPPSRAGRPRVLIGLSTFPWPGMDAVAARILEADSASDVEVVFTTGPSLDPAQLSVPRNVEVHRFVDHGLLMPDVDVMITHGGHGTAMRALAHDLPLLMLPLHPICASPCAPCPPASTLSNPACDRSTREDGGRPTSRTDGRPTRGTDRHKPPRPQVTNQRSDPRPVVSALAVGARTDPADDPTGVTAARCARWSTGCATRGVGTRATGTPGSCSTPATTVPGWRSCLPTYPCSSSPGCGRTGRGCGRFPSAVPDHRIGGPATARR